MPGHVATVALTQINNHWTNSWKPGEPGVYELRYKGKIQDLYMDHLASDKVWLMIRIPHGGRLSELTRVRNEHIQVSL